MSQDEKLQDILDSYYNGQKSQMVSQIKSYGINAFMIDFWDFLQGYGTNYKADYAVIVHNFFYLK